MGRPTWQEGHLVVAAIRVLSHLRGRAPRPEEIAEQLELPAAIVGVWLQELAALHVVAIVESAFDVHVEIRDHLRLEELEHHEQAGDLSADLADFDRRKQEESERMEKLFQDGDHQKRQAERLRKMGDELRDFQRRKPRNPFDEDDG
jgi:hypothetical protein